MIPELGGMFTIMIVSNSAFFERCSSSISKSSCMPSQNFAVVAKYFENRNAVSAVMRLLPFIIAETLVGGIPISFESRQIC